MFRQLATWFEEQNPGTTGSDAVFALHPLQLTRFLEEMWVMRTGPTTTRPAAAVPVALYGVEAESGIKNQLTGVGDDIYPTSLDTGGGMNVPFRHLIYAYVIENTRAFEIVAHVLRECLHGETLDVPSPEGQAWLRATEALFFSDPHPGGVAAVTSSVRPDIRAVRCNAYFRLFGIDLNHGLDDGRPYPYTRADAANHEFIGLFEEFLREAWKGIENFTNTSGANPTDDAAIAEIGASLADLLTVRQRNGALTREAFTAVAAMSWLHLTLMSDTPIIVDLKANATSPEERLRKLGERVSLPSHPKSEQHFAMADAISNLVTAIEARQFANPVDVPVLYTNTPGNQVRADVMTVVAQWSIATGRDMKAARVGPSTAGHPAPASHQLPAAAGANGHHADAHHHHLSTPA
jgi:hypothetical protein